MIFGINITSAKFEQLRTKAAEQGFKSTERYVESLIQKDLDNSSKPKPPRELTIPLKEDPWKHRK